MVSRDMFEWYSTPAAWKSVSEICEKIPLMKYTPELVQEGFLFPETPRWHAPSDSFYFVDIDRGQIYKWKPGSPATLAFQHSDWISGYGFVSGGTVTLPPAPTRAGYTFDGWFTAQTGGTKFGASFSPSDGNVAVHAQWTQNPAPAPAATPVMISATPRALPTTGNDVGSLLLAAFALMVLGLYVRARRTELCA